MRSAPGARLERVARTVGDKLRWRAGWLRRHLFLLRCRHQAWSRGATLTLDVAPDVDISLSARIEVSPDTTGSIVIGSGCRLMDGVLIRVVSGSLHLGPRTEVRSRVLLDVGGELIVEGDTPISWGTAIHCAEQVIIRRTAGIAEQVTISDSTHHFITPDELFWQNVRTAPVELGPHSWLCPGSVVTRGVRIGRDCIIASNTVVTADVPDGSLVSGVPGTVVRATVRPWLDADGG